ncbi:DEAD/DEAH box helicase family protein [Paenibacillus alkaliterrae]|uniref:DEAD/DEAH box helicase family protein n=1 Tax=Paenibacillus alkaliterrae TaxID=320909 RepID=UPI001F2B03C4|nr:DEAD/DEAH box helicase family protein [Paenibacillus alkaliterrae]MCF2940660.1 DEAD/DEAH box helicase family protein [Paenibacillus alkaliterrae]
MGTIDMTNGAQLAIGEFDQDTAATEASVAVMPSLGDLENIGDYLNLFGGDLIRRLNDEYKPVHHPGTEDTLALLSEIKRPLFNAQAHVVTALLKGFERNRRLFLIGEPGTGKTSMSIATFFALLKSKLGGKGRVIYMVPNHLIKKTKREVGILLDKNLFEVEFINGYEDVIRLRDSGKMNTKAKKMEVYIIARDTAKLGYIFEPVAKWVHRSYKKRVYQGDKVVEYPRTAFKGWVCPDCGGQLMKEEEGSMVPMEYEDFFNKHGKPTRKKNNLFCSSLVRLYKNADPEKDEFRECGAPLWQAKNKDKSSFSGQPRKVIGPAARKVSPADLFKRYFKHKFDLAIGDECHELTGGSAQAHAFHVLMLCAKHSIAMTGTLMNGYASNLFELIFRMFPGRLREMGFQWGEVGKWIDLYGVREKVTKIRNDDNSLNSSSNGSSKRVNTKEMPAAAPQLFTDMLSDVACFIQMGDMFEVLPDLQEGPMNVSLHGERRFISCVTKIERRPGRKRRLHKAMRLLAPSWYLERNLSAVEGLLRKAVEEELRGGGQSVLLGSLLSTTLSYPDVPFNFEGVYHPDTGKEIVSPSYRLSDRLLYPKELQLIKYVRERLKAGRKVGVYATFTGKLGTLQRLQMLLEERGIKTAVLESEVNGPEREEWIAKREKEGIQVLLTNPILVSTGLDLYGFPSLFFYQTGYRLSIVRQASRRHWRIGQKNLCETVYSGYKNTMQELAINLMAAKMNAALALEGQFSQEGLAALTEGSGGSLATELAKRFVGNNIAGVESAESIWGKMTIDASKLAMVVSAPVETHQEEEDGLDIWNMATASKTSDEPVSLIRSIYADSLQDAILAWAAEEVPADLFTRVEQQILFVEQNVMKGYPGLTVVQESLLGEFALQWDPTEVPSEPAEFRRWVFNMTNKPATERPKAAASTEWKGLELLVEGKMAKTKTKKVYNVSDGQFAFNF